MSTYCPEEGEKYSENKEEDTESANLLAKRMKEVKEKCQEQIAKGWRQSCLRASTSESEASHQQDFLIVTNK